MSRENTEREVMESRSERRGVAESPITNVTEGRREQAMRKALTITLVAALALFAGSAAYANYCARDVVPASTILVPYAVNDMDGTVPDYQGYTTILTITNVSKEAQLIHITVWNALSEACLDFNEVLSGYDVWQINFRDMIAGNFNEFDTSRSSSAVPNTGYRYPFEWGPDGRSPYVPPTAGVPLAGLPVPDTTNMTNSTDCQMPYNKVDVSSNVECLRSPLYARQHYGCDHVSNNLLNFTKHFNVRSKFIGKDWLSKLTDDPLFYYVTVDAVDRCNFLFPSDENYFAQRYQNDNILIGDIVYLSARDNFSEAINAVHIESDSDGVDLFNFYEEKLSVPDTDLDYLFTEPLATALAFNYYNGYQGVFSSVMMWKNFSEFIEEVDSDYLGWIDDCGPYLYYAWDMDEHTISRTGSCQVSPCSVNDIDPNEFPFETQKVAIDNVNFDLPGTAGWMLVVFPPSFNFGPSGDATNPEDNFLIRRNYMAWAGVTYNYAGYSAGVEAATLANAHCFNQRQPVFGIDYDTLPLVISPAPVSE
jgi:hypothetical protein